MILPFHEESRSDEKKPMANKMTKTAKLRSKPLAGAMLLVDGVNCVLVTMVDKRLHQQLGG